MNRPAHSSLGDPRQRAFTLVELLVATAIASSIGVAIFAFLSASTFLASKNVALNLTSNHIRTTLDRVEQVIQQGDTNPVLITTSGAPAGSGPAAGVKLDRYLGGPYVVNAPSTGLSATATTISLIRSTHALASPPIPKVGDVLRIDAADATLRPRVAAVSVGTTDAALHQTITITLTAPLGTTVPNPAATTMTARLVSNVAFIVMSNGGNREMRYYDSFEGLTDLADKSRYAVISDQISLQAEDVQPFSLVQMAGKTFMSFSLRVRAGNADRRLLNKQSDEFNTYTRVESFLRPKTNP